MTANALSAPSFGMDDEEDDDSDDEDDDSFTPIDYGTNLWLQITSLSNATAYLMLSNTLADVEYEIQGNTNLATTNWISEGFVLGSELTNWTPTSITVTDYPNLFLRVRSWIDSDNIGIPDWWQLEYFSYIGINPYADSSSGDGYTIWQKYQNGLNPNAFETPPAPSSFYAVLSTNGTDVLLSWDAPQGTVVSYFIQRAVWDDSLEDYDYTNIAVLNTNTFSFLDAGIINDDEDLYDDYYILTAVYANGNSSTSSYIYDVAPTSTPSTAAYDIYVLGTLVRNSTGRWQLMFAGLPDNAQTVNLIWTDGNGNSTTQNISVSILTNGIYQIPDTDIVNYLGDTLSVQGVGANGELGQAIYAGVVPNDAPYFVDGRQHLKQNLNFLIRGASRYFNYGYTDTGYFQDNSTTNFEESSFLYYSALDNLWPFKLNSIMANFLADTTRTNDIFGTNYFNFQINFSTNIPASPLLAQSDPYWIIQFAFIPNYSEEYVDTPLAYNPSNWWVTVSDFTEDYLPVTASLQNSVKNLFGLPYETGLMVESGSLPLIYDPLAPGDTISANAGYGFHYYASWCPPPTLVFTNYYFAPLINPSLNTMSLPQDYQQPLPLPLDGSFNVTNQTPPVIITAVGQSIIIGGWAKYAIQESSPTKYAYLGQYFITNAFLLDETGNPTSTNAGILSPYGEFFPTQAGKVQLVTMPDIDTGQQGTCTVSVISLNVDANHDGNMDLSYFGQDQTSPAKPYVFWCNNNSDRLHTVDGSDSEQDDMPPQNTPDYDFAVDGYRAIPCARDLEDYSRLWINGVTSNLLASLPAGSTITLNWGDVGNPNSSNPTIDLFQAADADGGIGYLTNNSIALEQTNAYYMGRLSPGNSIQLNTLQYAYWAGNYFIWCGVTNGSGKLNLTFQDANGNVLGQASVYIKIKDIKQMYERWTVGDDTTKPPATIAYPARDLPSDMAQSFKYSTLATTNTPYILFVHGWNLPYWEKDRYAETAFKRLYWQGYQGRFGEFRWPTGFGFSGIISALTDARNYDNSESNAWASATGLSNKLNDLNAEYPGKVYLMAHSMGNVVAGEALRLGGSSQVVNSYIAMQGAVPAHCYDATATTRAIIPIMGLGQDDGTPNRYANYYTDSSPCYFSSSAGAGTYVNFFNTNDYALSATLWQLDQNLKPDDATTPAYHYVTPSGTHPSGFYRQSGSFETDLYFPTNTYELFAYGDEARCYALGAQADVGGAFTTARQVDLSSVWPIDTHPEIDNRPYSAHVWHSAEFRSDNAQRAPFWNTVLIQMGLK